MDAHATSRRDWLRQTGVAALGAAAIGVRPGALDAAALHAAATDTLPGAGGTVWEQTTLPRAAHRDHSRGIDAE